MKCPISKNDCCKTNCAWFIESTEESTRQKELDGCAIKLLALAQLGYVTNSRNAVRCN